jgi:hypothetical protein
MESTLSYQEKGNKMTPTENNGTGADHHSAGESTGDGVIGSKT